MTADAAVSRFLLAARVERNLSPKTLKAYASDLRDLAKTHPGKPLRRLRREDLHAYLDSLQTRGLKETTIRRRLATLKLFYAWLKEEHGLRDTPTRGLRRRYQTTHRIPRVLPLGHVEAILRAAHAAVRDSDQTHDPRASARAARDRALLEVLFSTGIRSEEAVRLDLRDLDLERRTLHVSGKGKRERQVYLSSDEVLAALRDHLTRRHALAPTDDALFLNRHGRRLGVQSVRTTLARALRRARLDVHVTPHMLRHTMATLLIENGADVRSAQEILGHSNIRTTEIYVEVSRRRKEAVLSRFNPRNSLALQHEQKGGSDN